MDRIGLVIPTLRAGASFEQLLCQLDRQGCKLARKLVVDSSSEDGTVELAAKHGFETRVIPRKSFNHGLTRQQAIDWLADDVDIVVFLTQDVLMPESDALSALVAPFADEDVGAVCGRQLPHVGASLGTRLQREFSYGSSDRRIVFEDRKKLGIRAAFLSDAFSAYRVKAIQAVGGFPKLNVSEDMYMGAKLLMNGWALYYAAGARVHHSHEYGIRSAYRRYSEIGRFQSSEKWILDTFGKSEGAGLELLKKQMQAAWDRKAPLAAAGFIMDDAVKYLAFRMGRRK